MEYYTINGNKYNKYKILSIELQVDDTDSGGYPYIAFRFGYNIRNSDIIKVYIPDVVPNIHEGCKPINCRNISIQNQCKILKKVVKDITEIKSYDRLYNNVNSCICMEVNTFIQKEEK